MLLGAKASACSPPPPPPYDETVERRVKREESERQAAEAEGRAVVERDRQLLQDSAWIYFGRVSRIEDRSTTSGSRAVSIWIQRTPDVIKGRPPRSLKIADAGGFPGVCGGWVGYDYRPGKVGDRVLVLGGDTIMYRNYIREVALVQGDRAIRLISLMRDTPVRP
jgi:hypothetical protein